MEINGQRHENARHQLHTAGVAEQNRKFVAQGDLLIVGVEPFEGAIPRLLKEDQDGENLCWVQPCRPPTAAMARRQQFAFPQRFKAAPKRVHRARQIAYIHGEPLAMRDLQADVV